MRERVLGPEHQSTLAALDSLASWTEQAGDRAGVLGLPAERERVLPDTPITHELARWSERTG